MELDTAIEVAMSALDTAIVTNRLHDDPLRHVLAGLIAFLKAQKQIYAEGAENLASQIALARQPVRDDELRRAVTSGVAAHARGVIDALNWTTATGLLASAVVAIGVGFGMGAIWQNSRVGAEVDRMAAQVRVQDSLNDRIMVEAKELGSVVLSARSAAIWTEIVQHNPNVAEALRDCQPLKQPAGSACLLPIWLIQPPPKLQTPATR